MSVTTATLEFFFADDKYSDRRSYTVHDAVKTLNGINHQEESSIKLLEIFDEIDEAYPDEWKPLNGRCVFLRTNVSETEEVDTDRLLSIFAFHKFNRTSNNKYCIRYIRLLFSEVIQIGSSLTCPYTFLLNNGDGDFDTNNINDSEIGTRLKQIYFIFRHYERLMVKYPYLINIHSNNKYLAILAKRK